MRLVPVLLLSAGCASTNVPPPSKAPDLPAPAAAATVSPRGEEAPPVIAAVPEPAPVAPATPAPDCSASSSVTGTRWIGRFLYSGTMPGPDRLNTFVFGRDGKRATLVVEGKLAKKSPGSPVPGDWQCVESLRLSGTVEEKQGRLVFSFEDAARPLDSRRVTCKPRRLRVAGATAVRVAIPSDQEGCNRHRWSPAPSVEVRAFECVAEYVEGGESGPIFVARAPGLEHVTYDEDDCWDPAEALRLVAADGAVAPVRREDRGRRAPDGVRPRRSE